MKVVLIYNPSSGGQYALRSLKRLFKEHDVRIDYSFTVKQLGSNKLASLIARGSTIAVVGGDGTLNSAARRIVGTKSVLLPLPGGTFNHFIRDLGMPADIEAVLGSLSRAKQKRIDVAYVNDELFLNNSNLGLYPFSLIERKSIKKVAGKWIAAVLSAFDQLTAFRRHALVIDGKKVRSPFVFVGNSVYDIERAIIPQRSNLTKGVLTVMVATSKTRRQLIAAVMAVLRGNAATRKDFTVSTRKDMTIYSHRSSLPVSFDGEVKRLKPPLVYTVRPKSLNVLVVKAKARG